MSFLPVTMRFLNTTSSGSRFPSCFGSQLLSGSFSTSRFTSSLLGTGHVDVSGYRTRMMLCRCSTNTFIWVALTPRARQMGKIGAFWIAFFCAVQKRNLFVSQYLIRFMIMLSFHLLLWDSRTKSTSHLHVLRKMGFAFYKQFTVILCKFGHEFLAQLLSRVSLVSFA